MTTMLMNGARAYSLSYLVEVEEVREGEFVLLFGVQTEAPRSLPPEARVPTVFLGQYRDGVTLEALLTELVSLSRDAHGPAVVRPDDIVYSAMMSMDVEEDVEASGYRPTLAAALQDKLGFAYVDEDTFSALAGRSLDFVTYEGAESVCDFFLRIANEGRGANVAPCVPGLLNLLSRLSTQYGGFEVYNNSLEDSYEDFLPAK